MGGSERILLVVDDIPAMGRAVQRGLQRVFDRVLVAENVDQAEKLLADPATRPTHVLCDDNLGLGSPKGMTLLVKWRLQHPGIELAAILTGSEDGEASPELGIDRIFRKPIEMAELRKFFTQPR